MPRIERFFASSKVTDWTSGSFGGGGGDAFAVDPGSGNTTTSYTGYESREFTSPGSFTVTGGAGVVDILIVGGGGGGGSARPDGTYNDSGGGGGGAGGMQVIPGIAVSATGGPAGNGVYPVTIGAGGAGATYPEPASPGDVGFKGTESTFGGIDSAGGGAGLGDRSYNGSFPHPAHRSSGGASGGGNGCQPITADGQKQGSGGTPGIGNNGGGYNAADSPGGVYSPSTQYSIGYRVGSGGGGAGAVGGDGYKFYRVLPGFNHWIGGAGGAGVANVYKGGPGAPVTYAGGGGGAMSYADQANSTVESFAGAGGAGGGGAGGSIGPTPGSVGGGPYTGPVDGGDGTANTGGGGGGGSPQQGPPSPVPSMGEGGAGGSGVVVVRWAV